LSPRSTEDGGLAISDPRARGGGEQEEDGQGGDPAEGGEQAGGGQGWEDGDDGREESDADGSEDELAGFADDEGADDFA
jgi:hypothetical protein